jgi:heat shock protein HtpX
MRNLTKVWIFIVSLSLFSLLLGYNLGGRAGLLAGFFVALGFNVLIFFFSENSLFKRMRAVRLLGQDSWGLIPQIENMARHAGIFPVPRLYLLPQTTPTALAVGHVWRGSAIGVSEGLLEKFNEEERQAILAYLVCCIHCLGGFWFGVVSLFTNSIMGFAELLDRPWPRVKPFTWAFTPLIGLILKVVATDRSFFQNDDLAASLLHDKNSLARCLWKLQGYSESLPIDIPACTSHLFIVNPKGLVETNWLLKSHPKTDVRIRRLVGFYPL